MNTADPAARAAPAAAGRAPRAKSRRKRHYAIHSWTGFQLTLLSFLVLLTGALATIGDEIDWALDADRRITPVDAPPAWDAMFATARATRPDHAVQTVSLGEFASDAAEVRTITPGGHPHRVLVHPADGALQGEAHWLNAQRLLRDLHRYLFIGLGGAGLPIVTIVAGVLGVQLVTGLVNTRKWGRAMITVRANRGARVLFGDLHRASGVWASWFVVLMVVTSAWYFVEWGMVRLAGVNPEAERAAATAPPPDERGALSWLAPSEYVAAARSAYPELEARSILFPRGADGAVAVMGRGGHPLVRDRAARVFLDPYDASVLRVQRPGELTVLEYVTELADPLHFGDFAGSLSKWLWFAFGVILTGLAATGTWLTWRRTRAGVSRWHLATTGVLLVATVFGIGYVQRFLGDGRPEGERTVATTTAGGWHIDVRRAPGAGQWLVLVRAEDGRTARPDLDSAALVATDGARAELKVRGGFAPMALTGAVPGRAEPHALAVELMLRDGRRIRTAPLQ